MIQSPAASRNPWTFLPTLYFAEGLPYVIINTVSVILYKRMGIDNAHIAFWFGLGGAYGTTYQVDRQSHSVIVLMIQLMPNATDIQPKFSTLVYQSLVK